MLLCPKSSRIRKWMSLLVQDVLEAASLASKMTAKGKKNIVLPLCNIINDC